MKSKLVTLALTIFTLASIPYATQEAHSNEPPETPIPGKFSIQCKGLKYDDGKKFAAAFFIDPAHNFLTYRIALEGAPLASGTIQTVNQTGFKTAVTATDFYGNGQILDFGGSISKLVFIPAYDPPIECPRCSPGWPAHEAYQSLKYAGISLYQAFPYTNKAYTSGRVSYSLPNGTLAQYAFKTATCSIQQSQ
jgi:hypothetical protein